MRNRNRRQMRVITVTERVFTSLLAACLALLSPASMALADGASGCNPVAPAPSGIAAPTGAWAPTFTYNSCTGLYENQYYTWSPATQTAAYIWPMPYSCDTTIWEWTAQKYIYIPANNDYEPVTIHATQLPVGAVVADGSLTACTPPPPPAANSTSAASVDSDTPSPGSGVTQDTTATDSSASSATSATLKNYIGSAALSGSAAVIGNTAGGDATSGDATAIANVLNTIQSSASLAGAVTFVANVDGNVQGNLLIDPSLIQPASGSSSLDASNKIDANATNSGTIANQIDLSATSGDAKVAQNTTGGNATSGDASAIADVMNLINTMIGANQSFVGVVNINGNLQGDILVPQSFLDKLIASNAPAITVTVPADSLSSVNTNASTTSNILNSVTSQATSGQVTVANNTDAGSATGGDAQTNVTIFNLTGSNVVGRNALLVFVNVLGKWVGVIMDAPAGTTAAALGGGITSAATNSVIANAANNNNITNDIRVAAASGAATVVGNTAAGNARSGNAGTAVNLLNISNSNYSLSDWFGVLFINVFGTWYGNFDAIPAATDSSPVGANGSDSAPAAYKPVPASPPPVFRFEPTAGDDTAVTDSVAYPSSRPDNVFASVTTEPIAKVLAANTARMAPATQHSADTGRPDRSMLAIGSVLTVLGIAVIIGERAMTASRSRQ